MVLRSVFPDRVFGSGEQTSPPSIAIAPISIDERQSTQKADVVGLTGSNLLIDGFEDVGEVGRLSFRRDGSNDDGEGDMSFDFVRERDDGTLGDERMRRDDLFDQARTESMTSDIDEIVSTREDRNVSS